MAEKEEDCSRDLKDYSGEDDLNALVQSVTKTVGEEKLNEGELHYAVLRLRELIGGTKQSYASAWIAVVAVAGTFFAFFVAFASTVIEMEQSQSNDTGQSQVSVTTVANSGNNGPVLAVGLSAILVLVGVCFAMINSSRESAHNGAVAAVALELLEGIPRSKREKKCKDKSSTPKVPPSQQEEYPPKQTGDVSPETP